MKHYCRRSQRISHDKYGKHASFEIQVIYFFTKYTDKLKHVCGVVLTWLYQVFVEVDIIVYVFYTTSSIAGWAVRWRNGEHLSPIQWELAVLGLGPISLFFLCRWLLLTGLARRETPIAQHPPHNTHTLP